MSAYAVHPVTHRHHWRQATQLLWDYVGWIREASGLDPLAEQPSFRRELDDLAVAYGGPDATLYVAVGDFAGVVATVAARHGGGATELKRLFVSVEHRGRGLAARLVETVIADAAARGSSRVWLESVRGFMDPALTLYERCGFVEVEVGVGDSSFDVPGLVVMERPIRDLATPA